MLKKLNLPLAAVLLTLCNPLAAEENLRQLSFKLFEAAREGHVSAMAELLDRSRADRGANTWRSALDNGH